MAKADPSPILARLPAGRPIMVEVGTAQGWLAEQLLTARRDLVLHCVDSWWGSERQSRAYRDTGDTHAALSQADQDKLHRMAVDRLARFANRATIHHRPSIEAAFTFADASVDLAFLDADHSYEGVSADILAWWPKVKLGGWLGGHDHANPDPRFTFGVDRGVRDWLAAARDGGLRLELDDGLTWWVRRPLE